MKQAETADYFVDNLHVVCSQISTRKDRKKTLKFGARYRGILGMEWERIQKSSWEPCRCIQKENTTENFLMVDKSSQSVELNDV